VTPSQQETLRNAIVNPDPNDTNNPVNQKGFFDLQAGHASTDAKPASSKKASTSKASKSKS
jgi:hypothetical protein